MRFFSHDGKALHGPSTVPELIALPGFDGDTLVCPVGASDSNDWKPALAYTPFREALLTPAPKPASAPVPAPRPAPTVACPKCAHANPEGARYCNACAARMDGTIDPPPVQPAPEPFAPPSDLMPAFATPVVETAPIPAAAPAESSAWRKTMIAAFIGAAAASSALGWWLLKPSRHPAPAAARPTLSAPEPSRPVPTPATITSPAPTTPMVKPAAARPAAQKAVEKPAAKRHRAPRAKRAKRAVKPRDGHGESLIESHTPAAEPAAPAAEPAPAAPAAPAERGFILPGIPRPVSKSAVAAPAPAAADDVAAHQVREQFDFCAQLLAQGAYADHFDTCLCADARSAAPYRGRRGFYAAELKRSSAAGRLASSAEILSATVEGNSATVKALWKTSAMDAGRESPQRWRLEDGLWCRAP